MTELYRYLWMKARSLAKAPYESVIAMYVDRHYAEIATVILSTGTKSTCMLHPRDVFRIAVQLNAFALIIAHTHPSGNSEPSEEDRTATRVLEEAGGYLCIPLIGHIVITQHAWQIIESEAVEKFPE